MAKVFTKSRLAERQALVDKLNEAAVEVKTAYEKLDPLLQALNDEIKNYNEALEKAQTFRDEISEAIEDFINEKSDSWQEGDTGTSWNDLRDSWESTDLDSLDKIDDIEEPNLTHADTLEDLSTEIDS